MPRPVIFSRGRLTARDTLDHIIQAAFHLEPWEYSGPLWLGTEYYDLQAIVRPDTSESAREAMLQAMLDERFSLKYHREAKQISIYVLTVGKDGVKLPAGADDPRGPRIMSAGVFEASAVTIKDLANFLTYSMDHPVLDMTGISAKYGMHFDWSAALHRPNQEPPKTEGRFIFSPPAVIEPGEVSASLHRVGLQLDSRKTSVNMLVIDSAKREPTPN